LVLDQGIPKENIGDTVQWLKGKPNGVIGEVLSDAKTPE
jgi:hypothetical protein